MMVYQQDNRAFASSNSFLKLFFSSSSDKQPVMVAPAVSPVVMKTVEDLNSSNLNLASSALSIAA
jgi:hypothetical protein